MSHSFKGNPRNVTFFGESAGGAPVALLMLSPLASGMYRNVQSGSAVAIWSAVELDKARKSAEYCTVIFHYEFRQTERKTD